MAYIDLGNNYPGMRSLLVYSSITAKPINEMAEILLRPENSSLSRGERELIGTYVSYLNECFFCQNAHGAIAQHYLQCDLNYINSIKKDYTLSDLSAKMKTLLKIAASVQLSGKNVTQEIMDEARSNGAKDSEIHDTVLISAFFCMCNRYVDGLGTSAPEDVSFYIDRGTRRAEEGYLNFDLTK